MENNKQEVKVYRSSISVFGALFFSMSIVGVVGLLVLIGLDLGNYGELFFQLFFLSAFGLFVVYVIFFSRKPVFIINHKGLTIKGRYIP